MGKKETGDLFKLLGWGVMGGIVTALVVNMTPGVKDARPVFRSLIQLGTGFGMMLLGGRWQVVKLMGTGAFIGGALMAAERATGLKTLAGRGRLSARDLMFLQQRGAAPTLSGPMEMRPMNGPMEMRAMGGGAGTSPQFMGTAPQFMGRATGGFKTSY